MLKILMLAVAVIPSVAMRSPPLGDVESSVALQIVSAHNAARAEVGVEPIGWNPELAADAAEWAQHLASTGQFEHDPQERDDPEGENLWMGTRGHYPVQRMVQAWEDEKKVFRPGRFPDNSRTGSWSDVGHYTQMVWKDTREVGCAIARNASDEVLVCRYTQAGNVMGESPI